MRTLVTPLCTLEPQVAAHAAEMFAVLSDPAIYEFENEPPDSEEFLAQRYRRLESRVSADGCEVWLNWVVRLPSGRLAGYVQATLLDDRTVHVAYELNSQYWRQGIGSIAVAAMISELQHQYGAVKFVAVLKGRNFRSKGLLHKLGFVEATESESASLRNEADELVMIKWPCRLG